MKLGGFGNISFDLVAMLLDLALAMLFCSNWSRKRDRRGQKEWWTIRKSYEEIWKWFEATTERTNQQKIKYQVLFISCKPHDIRQCKVIFILLPFFGFVYIGVLFLLFYFTSIDVNYVEMWRSGSFFTIEMRFSTFALYPHNHSLTHTNTSTVKLFLQKSFSNWK